MLGFFLAGRKTTQSHPEGALSNQPFALPAFARSSRIANTRDVARAKQKLPHSRAGLLCLHRRPQCLHSDRSGVSLTAHMAKLLGTHCLTRS
jgi:hypothetical protein